MSSSPGLYPGSREAPNHTSKPFAWGLLQNLRVAFLLIRREASHFLPIFFSCHHFRSQNQNTAILWQILQRSMWCMHTQVKKPKLSASGICFSLVLMLQFSHLLLMFKKIIWCLRALSYSPHRTGILWVCIRGTKDTCGTNEFYISICSRDRGTLFCRRAEKGEEFKI